MIRDAPGPPTHAFSRTVWPVIGAALAAVALGIILVAPFEVRNSAPFGATSTFDGDRAVAVAGGEVRPNYDRMTRADLDLRAYTGIDEDDRFDLILRIRAADGSAEDARDVPFAVPGDAVDAAKAAGQDPYTTVRFAPIADSAGRVFQVWVERGPRNRDDVITVWSIKTFSRATGWDVGVALVRSLDEAMPAWAAAATVVGCTIGSFGSAGWLAGKAASTARSTRVRGGGTTVVHSAGS